MTPPGRLSLRLALLVGALGALLALALGAMAHWNLGRELEARERENLQLKLEQIRHSLEDDLDLRSDPAVQAHALQDQLVAHSGLHLSILDSRSGQPLMSFGDQAAASVAANRALLARLQADARQPVFQSWSTGNDQRLLSIGASMRMKNGTPVQVLLSSERNADERLLDGFLRATLLALPFLLPLIALAAWWVVRAGLEPLNRFRRVAAQVSPQDLSYRIPEQNLPRELDSLARSFNHMLGRLEDGVRQLSQFSDDLAHELRAPICNLLVRNQVLLSQHRDSAAYREALESNAEELERLSRIVTDMLFLVQVDNPAIQAQFGCVALHEQAAKVIDLYEMVAEDKGVELRLSGNGFAHGDNLMIQRAISNLVSNAVRHTPQGGRIDVRIGERAGHTEVRVSNDGPGIPPEYLPHLFERFYRPGAGHRAIDHGLPRRPRRSGKRTAAEDPPAPAVPFDGRCLTPVSATGAAPPQPVLAAETGEEQRQAERQQGPGRPQRGALERRIAVQQDEALQQRPEHRGDAAKHGQAAQPAEPVASARGLFRKLPRHVFTSTSAAAL